MKPIVLSPTFNKDKFSFKQLKRSRLTALYEKSKDGFSTYEVIRIKISKKDYQFPSRTNKDGETIPGSLRPAGSEAYPSNEDWGQYGFSALSRDGAEAKYRELLSKEESE